MALPPYGHPGTLKGVSMRGVVMVDTVNGSQRARAWPRGRKRSLAAATKARNEWFRQAQYLWRYIDPKTQQMFQEATKGTPYMPRDLFTQMLAGRFAWFRRPDGETIVTQPSKTDVSYSLDAISQTPGDMLLRTANGWEGVPLTFAVEAQVRAVRTTSQTAIAGRVPMAWQTTDFDDLGAWSISQPTRLTIPSGVTRAEFFGSIMWDNPTTQRVKVILRKNGTTQLMFTIIGSQGGEPVAGLASGPLAVTAGDYFELLYELGSTSGQDLLQQYSFFSARLIGTP